MRPRRESGPQQYSTSLRSDGGVIIFLGTGDGIARASATNASKALSEEALLDLDACVTGGPFLREVPCFEKVDDLLPWCCTTPRRVKLPGGGYDTERVTHGAIGLYRLRLAAGSLAAEQRLEGQPRRLDA